MNRTDSNPIRDAAPARSPLRWILPVAVFLLAAAGLALMIRLKPAVETVQVPVQPPWIRAWKVSLQDHTYAIRSQGTVEPRTESRLVSEVSGKVIEISPSFDAGGFFEEGDLLLKIDPYDYRQAVIRAEAAVARAELRLAQQQAEAEVARKEWRELGKDGPATPLTLHEPQVRDAAAALEASRADLDQARRNLERTEIHAPYAGRVRIKSVDVGQFVSRGAPLATLYAVDHAEIRLPLSNGDLSYVDLPMAHRGDRNGPVGPKVVLTSRFGGRDYRWEGRIVRTEGEIDPRTRMVYAIARVQDPYRPEPGSGRPPLAVGMFVQAEIKGRTVHDVARIPREALRGEGNVWIVDRDSRLRLRPVTVLRTTEDEAILGGGVQDGESICISPLAAATNQMQVRVFDGSEKSQ